MKRKNKIDIKEFFREVVDAYNTAKTKKANGSDKIDAQIVNDMDDELPEQVLSK